MSTIRAPASKASQAARGGMVVIASLASATRSFTVRRPVRSPSIRQMEALRLRHVEGLADTDPACLLEHRVPEGDVAEAEAPMPEEDSLVVRLAAGLGANDDLTELGVEVVLVEPPAIDVCAQRAELPGPRLAPVVDDDLVHDVGQRELDRAHRPVRNDKAARLDPAREQLRLGALESGRLDHHVRAAQALLPCLGCA